MIESRWDSEMSREGHAYHAVAQRRRKGSDGFLWTKFFGRSNVAKMKRADKFGNNKYDHAVEKLTDTLKCLATHPGDARERVTAAYFSFGHLQVEEFPEECRKDWAWIKKEITKFGPLTDYKGKVWRSSVENTMKTVKRSTGSKIAKKLYELYWAVSSNRQYE